MMSRRDQLVRVLEVDKSAGSRPSTSRASIARAPGEICSQPRVMRYGHVGRARVTWSPPTSPPGMVCLKCTPGHEGCKKQKSCRH